MAPLEYALSQAPFYSPLWCHILGNSCYGCWISFEPITNRRPHCHSNLPINSTSPLDTKIIREISLSLKFRTLPTNFWEQCYNRKQIFDIVPTGRQKKRETHDSDNRWQLIYLLQLLLFTKGFRHTCPCHGRKIWTKYYFGINWTVPYWLHLTLCTQEQLSERNFWG